MARRKLLPAALLFVVVCNAASDAPPPADFIIANQVDGNVHSTMETSSYAAQFERALDLPPGHLSPRFPSDPNADRLDHTIFSHINHAHAKFIEISSDRLGGCLPRRGL